MGAKYKGRSFCTPFSLSPSLSSILSSRSMATESIACTITFVWAPDNDHNFIDSLRVEHYPPELLFNSAHVGLFTRVTVPANLLVQVKSDIRGVASRCRVFDLKFQSTVKLFGKCVVLRVNRKQSGQAFSIRNKLNDRCV